MRSVSGIAHGQKVIDGGGFTRRFLAGESSPHCRNVGSGGPSLRQSRWQLRNKRGQLDLLHARIIEAFRSPLRQKLHENVIDALEAEMMPGVRNRYLSTVWQSLPRVRS